MPVAAAVNTLRSAGGIAGAINGIEQLKAWPHMAARKMLVPLPHPTAGIVPDTLSAAFPLKFSAAAAAYEMPAPMPGQDNDRIYGELLGLDAMARDELYQRGII